MTVADDSHPVLSAEGIDKVFQRGAVAVQALSGVGLRVRRGELLAVMGASGSGKSTLLHCCAGLTRPSAGRVLVEGQDLAGLSDGQLTLLRRRRLGLVFQAFNLLPALTVEANVMLPLTVDGRREEARSRVGPLLERLGLSHRRDHRPDSLSGGEQQRTAIARALISEPATILADEPTGNLDSVASQELCQLLAELCREQQRSVVVVTHEASVAAWADRIVVLKDGRNHGELVPAEGGAEALALRYQELLASEGAASSESAEAA